MAKHKDINITPSKGISIIIKNDIQQPPPIKPKKKRKYKKRVNTDLLKMPTMPSYIPGSGDVSYIKPQYAATTLNRSMIFPGVPQSLPQLTPPPPLPQLTAPPPQPQITAPQPFTFSLDNKFGNMLENILMPREYGYKPNSYEVDILDDDVMDALPPQQQDKYIEKQIKPQIEEQLKDIEFDNEADKSKAYKQAVLTKTAKEWGTKHANQLKPYDSKYQDNEYYKQNYISRLQDIINQDTMKTRGKTKTITTENKDKAKDLLKAIGIEPVLKVVAPVYATPPAAAAAPTAPPPEAPKPQPPPAAAAAAASGAPLAHPQPQPVRSGGRRRRRRRPPPLLQRHVRLRQRPSLPSRRLHRPQLRQQQQQPAAPPPPVRRQRPAPAAALLRQPQPLARQPLEHGHSARHVPPAAAAEQPGRRCRCRRRRRRPPLRRGGLRLRQRPLLVGHDGPHWRQWAARGTRRSVMRGQRGKCNM
jgi:hypothetical protein